MLHNHSLAHDTVRDLFPICRLSSWRWNSKRTLHFPMTGTRVIHPWGNLIPLHVRVGQSNNDAPCARKSPKPFLPRSDRQQAAAFKIVENISDHVGVAIDICRFNTTAFKCNVFWTRVDRIRDVLHPLHDVDSWHAAELEASIRHHGASYSHVLISVTDVHPAVEFGRPLRPSGL